MPPQQASGLLDLVDDILDFGAHIRERMSVVSSQTQQIVFRISYFEYQAAMLRHVCDYRPPITEPWPQ